MPTRSLDKDPINTGLLLSIPMFEGVGSSVVADVARPHHPITQVHAPGWTQLASGIWVMDFLFDDYLSCLGASCTDLNFTTGDFSVTAWHRLKTGLLIYLTLAGRSSGTRLCVVGHACVRIQQ
jgi:hypothetical protein